MAIKKAGLPNWYIVLYSIVCIIDGLIGLITIGFYTSNLQIIVALWYVKHVTDCQKPVIKEMNPIMYINED